MTRLILRLFDAMAWLIRGLGVDYPQFRAILEVKLTLDTRRASIAVQRHTRTKGNAFAGTLFFYTFMGVFVAFTALMAGSPLVGLTIVHAFVMTMLGMSLVADFSSVLLDTTDNGILQPRPVSARTLLASRIAHILVYLGSLSLSLSLATLCAGTYRWGVAFIPVFLLTLACGTALVICAVSIIYLLAIRFTSGERLRDIILYFQIVMSVGIVAGYQLMPRLMDMTQLRHLRIDHRWWIYVFPPAWMAAPIDLLAGNVRWPQIILSAGALIAPLAGLIIVTRVLAPRFSRALATMDAVSSSLPAQPGSHRRPLGARLARLCCRTPTARAAFELVWVICSRDRQFKLRTYPSLAFMFVFPLFILASGHTSIRETLATLPGTSKHLFVLYMTCAMLPTALIQLRFSDQWQAGWIYSAVPIACPGEVFGAAVKAMLLRFVLPAFTLIALLTLAIWGPSISGDVALAASAGLLTCILQAIAFGRRFPFSEGFVVSDASGRMAKSLLLLILPAALGGLHYLLKPWPIVIPAIVPVMLIGSALLFRFYARTPWSAIAR